MPGIDLKGRVVKVVRDRNKPTLYLALGLAAFMCLVILYGVVHRTNKEALRRGTAKYKFCRLRCSD
jgi:hypothetical protein